MDRSYVTSEGIASTYRSALRSVAISSLVKKERISIYMHLTISILLLSTLFKITKIRCYKDQSSQCTALPPAPIAAACSDLFCALARSHSPMPSISRANAMSEVKDAKTIILHANALTTSSCNQSRRNRYEY